MKLNRIFVFAKLAKHLIISTILKKKILNTLKYLAFTLLGVIMFWFVYRDQDFNRIWHTLVNDVNYFWIVIALIMGLLSHLSRTLRWKIALEPLNEKPRTSNTFIAVMVSYFMNLLLPRAGEFVRCGLMAKYEKISFSKLLGTVVTERIVDVLMLLVIIVVVLLLEFDKIIEFIKQYPQVSENLFNVFHSPILWVSLFLLFVGIFVYLYLLKRKGKKNKFQVVLLSFSQGIKSILAMRRYKAYIGHTIFIWLMYFMMLYMYILSLDATRHLDIVSALTTFVFTSLAMIAPVQGGIGAWHFMAEKALNMYGIESADGKIFALLAHSTTNLLILVCGAICFIIVPYVNKGYHPIK